MNILHVVHSLHPDTGGPARSIPSLAEATRCNGIEVQLYINDKENQRPVEYSGEMGAITVSSFRNLSATLQRLCKNKSTVIHCHGLWLPINHSACRIAKQNSVPCILSPRGMLEPYARNAKGIKKTLAWFLYQRNDLKTATLLHATSKQEAQNLLSLGFDIPIAVVPNGVQVPTLTEQEPKRKEIKTALFLSRIHPKKGLLNLVKAWEQIRPADWQVIVAGPDEDNHQAEVEKKIRQLNLTHCFKFVGSVTDQDKWELYRQADLFVLPTHSENFGIVIAEALASACPVITTKGTPWEELVDNNCGWWVDIGVQPLVAALQDALSLTQEERRTMGQRGRCLVEKKYSWNTIGKEMVSVYKWTIEGGKVPDCVMV